ncbi:hypothetical protein UlMin_025207 [Ulmus minor]
MATKRARKTQNQSSTIPVDRISKLPDPVIHHILSFLPTVDVVRLSILAKRWRRIWYSIPSLSFSDSDFSINDRKLFYKFVDECLRIRKTSMRFISDSVVTSFKLDIRYYGGSVRFDKWLSFAVKSKIQELELKMKPKCTNFAYCCLPGDVLKASSLVDVKLTCLKLEASFAISLPSLKSLSLASVELSDKVLHDVLLGCPSLEKLVLKECFDFVNLQISSSSLLFLEIISFEKCRRIQVEAINLQSFLYDAEFTRGIGPIGLIVNLTTCRKIRNLSLSYAFWIEEKSLEDLILGLPLLESLALHKCYNLRRIKIISQGLLCFTFNKFYSVDVEASIEAPNLVFFSYKGDRKFSLSLNSQNLLECKIIVQEWSNDHDLNWYINFIDFLSTLNCSKNLSLHVYSQEALIFPEVLRRICRSPCPHVKHLKIKTRRRMGRESALRYASQWISPSLETLSIEQWKYYV